MRILLTTIALLVMTISVRAQTLYGIVVSGETAKPLYPVSITNLNNQESTHTDAQGNYAISAKSGDAISFSFIGFHTIQRLATPGNYTVIELQPLSVKLQEFILRPDYTPFQKDSAALTEVYSKELNTQRVKPSFSSANGGGMSGLIGSVVQKMSKSYKKNKAFKETFKKDIEQKYIDTRYKPGLVTALTGFSGDTLAIFMNMYPMEYDFARAATDLELKMWIRDNYKDYLKPQNLKGPLQSTGQNTNQ